MSGCASDCALPVLLKAAAMFDSASGILNLAVNLMVLYKDVYQFFVHFIYMACPLFLLVLMRYRFFGPVHVIKDKPVGTRLLN